MKRLKVAVIGAGNWGRNHVRTLAAMPEVQLAAVCDILPARREQMERQYPGVLVTAEAGRAFAAAEAVVVATPAGTHASLAREALECGLPVLVEKPFALTVADAEAVTELAAARRLPVVVGHLLLFHPAIERLKALVRAGDLGTIYYLYSQRVNLGQIRPDENALWSFGPHDVSVALDLLGQVPVRVAAQGRSYLQAGIEDVVFLTMEFESGVMAHAQMSWLDPHKERRLTVVGSRRMVVFDDMQTREKLKIYDKGVDRPPEYGSYGESLAVREGDISIPRVPNAEPLSAELRHFVAVARGEVAPRVDAASGCDVVRVLAAASDSLTDGGKIMELEPARGGAR
ncbi:MAG: Gfo/Idh/MocA family oxidoreductase [Gemmatimonadetes bacterium]|nr:Gfo/Idh/MocA family oxidoreductase [Gemmatimonadota bacterium]